MCVPGATTGFLFEPSEYAFECLSKRFQQVKDITTMNICLSDKVGDMEFFEEPEGGQESSFSSSVSCSKAVKKNVKSSTLDVEAERYCLVHIDLLKIDTEGYDLHVLRGCSGLLSEKRIEVVQFEYGASWAFAGSKLIAAFNLLESFGYNVFILKSKGLYTLDYPVYGEYFEYSNFVALSPNSLKRFHPYIKGSI